MRIAILADIHANREALDAVLERIGELCVDRVVLLGDIIGYGPDPEYCVQKALELVEAGALAVKGNHDAAIGTSTSSMNGVANEAIDWTRPRLSNSERRFLAELPYIEEFDGVLFTHASARSPKNWEYISGGPQAERSLRATTHRLTVVGHVHVPHVWRLNTSGIACAHVPSTGVAIPLAHSQKWLAVMGSVGQPRDHNPSAAFGLLELPSRTLTYERVAYDQSATIAKIMEAGLPELLALRLQRGV